MGKSKIILVNDGFYLGGIEILELKIAKALQGEGREVVLCCNARTEEAKDLSGVTTFKHKGLPDLISRVGEIIDCQSNEIVLASFHPKSAIATILMAKRMQARCMAPVKVFHWVSHSRAFFFSRNYLLRALLKSTFFKLPKKSTFFMNDAAREQHAGNWNAKLGDYPVLRIIGRTPAVRKSIYTPGSPLRIVSVGRLVPFKAYNTFSGAILKELSGRGVYAVWDIWGYGPSQSEIEAEIQSAGMAERVRLRGALSHDDFDSTVSSYDVFVGMGTAALEAAKAGVPTVLALEAGKDMGYGFLSDVPGDTVGDKVNGLREVPVSESLVAFAELNEEARRNLGSMCCRSAEARESVLDDFIRGMKESEEFKQSGIAYWVWSFVAILYLHINKIKHAKNV